MNETNWSDIFHQIRERWTEFQQEKLKALSIEPSYPEHTTQVILLAMSCVSHVCECLHCKEPDLLFEVMSEAPAEVRDYIRRFGHPVAVDYREQFEKLLDRHTEYPMGRAIFAHLLLAKTEVANSSKSYKELTLCQVCGWFWLNLIKETVESIEKNADGDKIEFKDQNCSMHPTVKVALLLELYRLRIPTWKSFQRENLELLSIEYDPVKHDANVHILSAFCAHSLLGFDDRQNTIRRRFLQEVIDRLSGKVQNYVCQHGEYMDRQYFEAFDLVAHKKSDTAMGHAIFEQLLLCNERYGEYLAIPAQPTDALVTLHAALAFNNFIQHHQDIAKELQTP